MIRFLPLALALSVLACRSRGRPPDRMPASDGGAVAIADLGPLTEDEPVPAPAPARRPKPAVEPKPAAEADPPVAEPKPTAAEPKPAAAEAKPATEPKLAPGPKPARADTPAVAVASTAPASAPASSAPPPPQPDAGARPDGAVQAIVVEAEAAGAGSEPPGPSPSDLVAGPRHRKKARTAAAATPLPIPGGPLPIPAAKVDLDAVRVERFAETGGTTLEGRLLDVDSRQPVAGAQIEAWMGPRSIHAQSDGDGRFRFEGLVPKSKITLWITAAPTFVQERTELAVPAGDSFQTTYQLLPRAAGTGSRDAGVGLFLSRRGTRTVVTGLTAWGPAERAGIQAGEAVVAVGKRDVTALGPGAIDFLLKGPMGTDVTLTMQAGTAPARTLTLKRSGR